MPQRAFDSLQRVADELAVVQARLDDRRSEEDCVGSEKALVDKARAQSERTYLLRLLADFEGSLARIGPEQGVPPTFSSEDSLGTKLNRIGANMGIDAVPRSEADDQIRVHRNELVHGRSPVPRVSFASSHMLMKEFLRWCY